MTDEFEDLKRAFDMATPEADPLKKRENIARAEEIFAASQGMRHAARPTPQKSRMFRLLDGVKTMMTVLTSRAGLTASTAIVAVGMIAILPLGPELQPPNFELQRIPEIAPREADTARSPTVPNPDEPNEINRVAPGLEAGAETGTLNLADGSETPPVHDKTREERGAAEVASEEVMGQSGGDADDGRVQFSASGETDGSLSFGSRDTEGDLDEVLADTPFGPITRRDVLREQQTIRMSDMLAAPSMEETEGLTSSAPLAVSPESAARLRRLAPSDAIVLPEADTEAFASAPENTLKVVTEDPVSTFSIDVDTASYSVVRSSLTAGYLPPRDAVRVEEMVNYFPYAYPAPEGAHPFEPTISVVPTPWNEGTRLVHIGIQGELPAVEDRPPLNLVFLIDTSGSMQDANKLPLLKQSFRLMLSELRPEDEVSIVTYAGSAGQVLEPTRAAERSVILGALERLEAGGSTAGQAGLQQAYAVAEGMAGDGEVTRVILATDGDFNVGLSDPEALESFIAEKRESGTYLSVLGFGRGNLDDATMQALAQNGNGQAAYIDTLSEARKVLVDQLTGALFPIANDVKIQVEFNPAAIAEYRLIGYETRALAREDFNNDRVDAGDIGAGHRVTAIYEVTPVGSDAIMNGPLRYGEQTVLAGDASELGFFKLRYKNPGESESVLIEAPIPLADSTASEDVRFSIAMAGFGELLRGGTYLGIWDWDAAIDLASGARGEDPFGYRAEAVSLMRLAEVLDR